MAKNFKTVSNFSKKNNTFLSRDAIMILSETGKILKSTYKRSSSTVLKKRIKRDRELALIPYTSMQYFGIK